MTSASSTERNPNIWKKILLQNSRFMAQRHTTVLMFGRTGIGKRSLLHALEDVNSSSWTADREIERPDAISAQALNYAYLEVHNSRAIQTTDADAKNEPLSTSFWILEDIKHKGVLFSRLTEAKLKDAAVVICVDMQEPWNALADLGQWLEVVKEIYMEQIEHLPEETKQEYMQRVLNPVPEDGRSKIINFGIPIVVVVTRSDAVASWSNHRDFFGWSETVECYLRKECLEYGASLIYTMAPTPKQAKNVTPLYHYLGQLLGGFPFTPPNPSTPDAVFLAAGTDSMDAINTSAPDVTAGMTKHFSEIVSDPSKGQSDKGDMLETENINQFLQKAQALMKKDGNVRSFSRTAKGAPREDDKVLTKFFEKLLARDEPASRKNTTGTRSSRAVSQKTLGTDSQPARDSRRSRVQPSRVSTAQDSRPLGESRKSVRQPTIVTGDDPPSPSNAGAARSAAERMGHAPSEARVKERDAAELGRESLAAHGDSPVGGVQPTVNVAISGSPERITPSRTILSAASGIETRKRQSVIFNVKRAESDDRSP
eukprot:GEMP01017083.1.p1 GENE.GEMP01017083.1~~GEMP01017083.1.p1  ORF type:complete len:541 (+),score=116.35 GEMP01017083.1:180-1802(+)